jgi:hypothetical protein
MTLLETSTLVLVTWVAYRLENLRERVKNVEKKVFSEDYAEREDIPLSLGNEFVELREVLHGKRKGYTTLRTGNPTKSYQTVERDLLKGKGKNDY